MVRPDEIPRIEVSGGAVRSSMETCPACKAQTLNVKEEWDRTITSPDRPGESIHFGHATSAKCANCGWPKIDITVLPHVPEGFGRFDLGGAALIAPVDQLNDVAAKMVASADGGARWPTVVSTSVFFTARRPVWYRRCAVVMETVTALDWGDSIARSFAVRRFWLGRNARDLADLLNEFAGRTG